MSVRSLKCSGVVARRSKRRYPYSSSVRETFLHEFDLSRKHLLREMYHLRLVPGVLKKYHVVGVERNGPKLFGIQKEILHNEDHGHVPVVRW